MKKLKCLLLVALLASMTGCPKTRTTMPGPFRNTLIEGRLQRLKDLADKYDQAIDADPPDLGKARLYRNEVVYQAKQLIDLNYNDFENDLFVKRATSNVLMDITELGASAAAGFTNGERVKSIIAIALTAFKGGRRSIDLNFFRERTTEVIVLKMRASRGRVLQRINQGAGLDVASYTLASGIDDLIDYLNAGSVNSALLELAGDTGAEAREAREVAADLKISPFLNEAQRATIATIRDSSEKIIENTNSADSGMRAKGERQLNAVLTELGFPAADLAKTVQEKLALFQQRLITARKSSDQDTLDKMRKALDKALAEADPTPTPAPTPSPTPTPSTTQTPTPSPTPGPTL